MAAGSTRRRGAVAQLRRRCLGATVHEVDDKRHRRHPHLLAQLRDRVLDGGAATTVKNGGSDAG
jgi:hypothetical protein